MIERHPRLGYAVLAGVAVALAGLLVLFLVGGSGGPGLAAELDYRPATVAPEVAPQVQAPAATSRRKGVEVDPAWAARTGAAAGIPAPAMQAYGNAALALARSQPGCHLAWNTLAGIGWVESQHGTIDGRTLGADGRSSTPVIGPALDGGAFAAIRSTPDSAAWHGDTRWEHAVGPLQFLSSTWDRWGADGDHDGIADPLSIFDAALAAGRYLCADAHDLATVSGWNAAVHSYNHDQAYVVNVLNAANTYAQRAR